jgi:outer membrane protein, protease secretion system
MRLGRVIRSLFAAVLISAAVSMPAAAISLEEAYLAAQQYDADLQVAKAAQEETQEGVPVARAALLPQVSYSMQKTRADTYTDFLSPRPGQRDYDSGGYNSESSTLSLRQALFRKPAWDALQVAKAQAGAADASYLKETQNLGLRVVASYLDVLQQRTYATLTQKAVESMDAWLALAERAFKAGRGTLTDISDARSRRDIARAREAQAKVKLTEAARSFEVVTGLSADKIPELNPLLLDPDRMLLNQKESWLKRIEESSPEIQSLRMQLEAAKSNVDQMRSGHLPTVDLVAARRQSENDTDTSISNPAQYTTSYIGLAMTIPLLSGGGVLAQTSQALAKEEKVKQSLVSAQRKMLADADRLFLTIQQGSELVKALTEAVRSAEQAVQGEKKGIQAGTRTLVDALDAERRLYESMNEQAKATYNLAYNRFEFQALAGAIDPESIKTVSTWLAAAQH